jgi:hypothetical protein
MPLLFLFWILLALTVFKGTLMTLWNMIPFVAIGDFEIDENLDNYFDTLDRNDCEWSLEEERYYRKEVGLRVLDEYGKHKLQDLKNKLDGWEKENKEDTRNVMKGGAHCYDILASEKYQKDFQYYSPAYGEDRNKYIKDADEDEDNDMMQSDLVKVILNIAYLPPELAKNFTFDKEFYRRAKNHSHKEKS